MSYVNMNRPTQTYVIIKPRKESKIMLDKLHLRLDSAITDAVDNNLVPLIIPRTNTATPMSKSACRAIPDQLGVCIGRKNCDGRLIPNIKSDEDCAMLKAYIDNELVIKKNFTQIINGELYEDLTSYYVIYNVDESSRNRPTYDKTSCGYAIPINGYHKCEYELLLTSGNGYTRRMVVTVNNKNTGMYDFITELEDQIACLDNADEAIKNCFFKEPDPEEEDDKTPVWQFTMFDDIGYPESFRVNTREFLSMIASIRQLSCEFVETN